MYKERKELSPEKQAVTVVPDVTVRDRTKEDMFIMVACDGIWDCLTNQ
jgi:serine/threonine protein phosphatase PrpC